MVTLVTSHQFEIFKLFYEHKFHKKLIENLILYVDKEDEKDINEYKSIIDLSKTRIFTRKDIIQYYGDYYLPNCPYNKKMYFLNMLAEMHLIDDDFYMTDDDILIYDESFYDIMKESKIVYDKDTWPKIENYKNKWPNVYKWYNDNREGDPIFMRATNFYVPKIYAQDVMNMFAKKFFSFIRLLKNESDFIDKLNSRAKSNRGCDFCVFYLEVPFFDDVFASLDKSYFTRAPIYCVSITELARIRDKFKTNDIKFILEKYLKKSKYPKRQPLLHFNIGNKKPFMSETFNFINNRNINYDDINELLKHYSIRNKH